MTVCVCEQIHPGILICKFGVFLKSTKIKLPLTDVLLVYVDTLPFGHFTFFKQFQFAKTDGILDGFFGEHYLG